ncbi:ribokinase [Brooklawnia cerclae]|uniref:Ribokinase n=1 Tax=Brooklawnia cerclae TaxID=349934 RepID=A0ABX0SHA4_9ACTN|nr:ribokinase [Brooklawnia cerclae]
MRDDSRSRVFVVGSVNIDVRLGVEAMARPGETVLCSDLGRSVGGKGANQAVAVASLGAPTAFIGAVGDDDAGRDARAHLVRSHVDTGGLQTVGRRTGLAVIQVLPSGENAILVAPGANGAIDRDFLAGQLAGLTSRDLVITQLEIEVERVDEALHAARDHGALTFLNAAPARKLDRALLELVDVLVVNELEGAELSGLPETDAGSEAGLRALRSLGPQAVIQTLGAQGASYLDAAGSFGRVPAISTTVVDTTGAGDAFVGAAAIEYRATADLAAACRFGAETAARCVAQYGPLVAQD